MASTSQEQAPKVEDISLRARKKKRGRDLYRKKHKITKAVPLDHDLTNETDYYFENGLRKVYPYYYNFSTYVKGRWFGRTILDVFAKEFKSETEEKYRETIENGRLTVNGQKVSPDYVLGDNQLLEHTCHRHENPVLATPIQIIADTSDVLVINKPSSIPCHPCGRYRYNSITFILDKEYGYKHLRTLYRLDRLTSGVLILPKTTEASKKLEKQLLQRKLQKEYVCRVVGEFPEGVIECHEPLGVLSHKLSIYGVVPDGKESHTTFTRVSYNGSTSVVKCVPHTGRTHQIRLHLQFLGHPIVNDPLYNSTAFGPQKGKGGIVDTPIEQIEEHVMKTHNTGMWKIGDNPLYSRRMAQKKAQSCETSMGIQDSEIIDNSQAYGSKESENIINERDIKKENIAGGNDISNEVCSKGKASVDSDFFETKEGEHGKTELRKCYENAEKTESNIYRTLGDTVMVQSDLTSNLVEHTVTCEAENITPPLKRLRREEETKKLNLTAHCNPSVGENCASDSTNVKEQSQNISALISHQNATENIVQAVHQSLEESSVSETGLSNRSDIKLNCDPHMTDVGSCNNKNEKLETEDSDNTGLTMSIREEGLSSVNQHVSIKSYLSSRPYDEDKVVIDEYCDGCKYLYHEPKPKDLVMCLHAVKYKGPGWEYSTHLPDWAADDWQNELVDK